MKAIQIFALPSEMTVIEDGVTRVVVTNTQLFVLYDDGTIKERFSNDPEGKLSDIKVLEGNSQGTEE